MYKLLFFPLFTLLTGYALTSHQPPPETLETASIFVPARQAAPVDTPEFDQEKALALLREEIKGKEDLPSSEVYKNIKMLKEVPAGRLLAIMEYGFSRSLGVTCTHCHNPDNFADEDKVQKQITRDMMEMVGKINNDLLKTIPNLNSNEPTVNCTTCHRGDVTPAQRMME